jgi:hypothetical protein
MATKRRTKKFEALVSNPRVALLVHDFVDGPDASLASGTVSVTVYGDVEVVAEGARCERLRHAHAEINPRYSHFIIGDDVAIIAVRPSEARICDFSDRVSVWRSPMTAPSSPVASAGASSAPT